MGLDMYLYKKTYVAGKSVIIDGGPKKATYIQEEIGYWRKANAIHKWFIDNCADGVDDCKPISLSREKMEDLLKKINIVLNSSELIDGKIKNGATLENGKWVEVIEDGKIIKDPTVADLLLPTQDGFFFGSTEYNKWYIQNLQDTKKILEKALQDDNANYYYEASW